MPHHTGASNIQYAFICAVEDKTIDYLCKLKMEYFW